MLTPRTAMVITYRFFRAACCSARLGAASVMSTGSGRRDRAGCWLEATGFLPSAAPRDGGSPYRLRSPASRRRPDPPHSPGSAAHRATGSRAMQAPRRCISGGHGRLRRALGLLLGRPDLGQRLGPGDVGDRPPGALLAVVAGGLPPARRGHAVLLAEQRDEDLRLLRAEPGQLPDPLQQGGAVGHAGPQRLGP